MGDSEEAVPSPDNNIVQLAPDEHTPESHRFSNIEYSSMSVFTFQSPGISPFGRLEVPILPEDLTKEGVLEGEPELIEAAFVPSSQY